MLSNLSFTGAEVFLGLFFIIILFSAVLLIGRYRLAKFSNENLKEKHLNDDHSDQIKSRNKYPEVNVFRYSNTFWKLGLVMTLALTVVSFNWTQYEYKADIPEDAMSMDFDLELETTPQTATPPPPPPPPPPVIEEVPSDVILENEPDSFADQSADLNTSITNAPVASNKVKAPPPPPPPPPPSIEIKEIFKVVEEMPRFPGCEDLGSMEEKKACAQQKLLEFVYANIVYPPMARENHVTGTVVIRFVVDEKGTVKQAEILRDVGGGCGEEALRVVNLMNTLSERWTPGQQRGRNVKVYFTFPVKFKLMTG